MLHTTGLALNHSGVANMALAALKEMTPLVVKISQVIPGIVVQDLAEEEVQIAPGVEAQAVQNTQVAWSRESINI
jgi:hypothetical protein